MAAFAATPAAAQTGRYTCINGYVWDYQTDGYYHDARNHRVACPFGDGVPVNIVVVQPRNDDYRYSGSSSYRYNYSYRVNRSDSGSNNAYRNGYRAGQRDAVRPAYDNNRTTVDYVRPPRYEQSRIDRGYTNGGTSNRNTRYVDNSNRRDYGSDRSDHRRTSRHIDSNEDRRSTVIVRERFRNNDSGGRRSRSSDGHRDRPHHRRNR